MRSFSIIIPAFNRFTIISKAIESIINQNYKEFEVIVVDDGSTDNTFESIKKYSYDSRIKYIYQNNRGVCAARNLGVINSIYNYILFLDSDDFVSETWLEDFNNKLDESDYDLIFCGFQINKTRSDNLEKVICYDIVDIAISGTFLLKKKIFFECGGYDENLKFGENTELGIRYIEKCKSVGYIKKINLFYTWSFNGGSKNINNRIHAILYNLKKYEKIYKNNAVMLVKAYNLLAINYLRVDNYKKSRYYILKSLRIKPVNHKSWMRLFITLFPKYFQFYFNKLKNYGE